MDWTCFKCNAKQICGSTLGETCFSCDGCFKKICEECTEMEFTASEIRVLALKKKIKENIKIFLQ